MKTKPAVLLVQRSCDERETLADWIEGAGYDVVLCSGPVAPSYVCVGDRTGSCPLIEDADVVVLDCRLQNQSAEATSPADLLSLYVCSGRPVVVLGSEGLARLFADDDAIFLDEENEDGTGLLDAIRRLIVRPRAGTRSH